MTEIARMDGLLTGIDHFRRYPAMLPYIGEGYCDSGHRRMLIMGESNYLPPKSTIHLDPQAWYAGDQIPLSAKEVEWLHCRDLLTLKWNPRGGHKIYHELNRCLREAGIVGGERATNSIAYMNAFQRPAATSGESMEKCHSPVDSAHSFAAIADTIRSIEPEIVVIVSQFTWQVFGTSLQSAFPDLRIEHTCHPATHFYWNKAGYPHGRDHFMTVLRTHFIVSGPTVSAETESAP